MWRLCDDYESLGYGYEVGPVALRVCYLITIVLSLCRLGTMVLVVFVLGIVVLDIVVVCVVCPFILPVPYLHLRVFYFIPSCLSPFSAVYCRRRVFCLVSFSRRRRC